MVVYGGWCCTVSVCGTAPAGAAPEVTLVPSPIAATSPAGAQAQLRSQRAIWMFCRCAGATGPDEQRKRLRTELIRWHPGEAPRLSQPFCDAAPSNSACYTATALACTAGLVPAAGSVIPAPYPPCPLPSPVPLPPPVNACR